MAKAKRKQFSPLDAVFNGETPDSTRQNLNFIRVETKTVKGEYTEYPINVYQYTNGRYCAEYTDTLPAYAAVNQGVQFIPAPKSKIGVYSENMGKFPDVDSLINSYLANPYTATVKNVPVDIFKFAGFLHFLTRPDNGTVEIFAVHESPYWGRADYPSKVFDAEFPKVFEPAIADPETKLEKEFFRVESKFAKNVIGWIPDNIPSVRYVTVHINADRDDSPLVLTAENWRAVFMPIKIK